MKIKDYGKFRRFLKDRRLPNLMAYYETEKVSKTALQEELYTYEVKRIAVLEAIFKLEETAFKKYNHHFETLRANDTGGIIQHKFYLEHLVNQNIIDQVGEKIMEQFRNKFSHNEYPLKSICNIYITTNNACKIAEQLAGIVIKKYVDVLQKINLNND